MLLRSERTLLLMMRLGVLEIGDCNVGGVVNVIIGTGLNDLLREDDIECEY